MDCTSQWMNDNLLYRYLDYLASLRCAGSSAHIWVNLLFGMNI
jgi:hypothetical protein